MRFIKDVYLKRAKKKYTDISKVGTFLEVPDYVTQGRTRKINKRKIPRCTRKVQVVK